MDGELDTIVGKCLEEAPDRRYASAADLAEDLERYLESRPIRARPPSAVYRLRKLVVRHRVATVQGAHEHPARHRCVGGAACRLAVTDFTEHQVIRIQPQDGLEPRGKSQAVLVVDLHLRNAVDLVFDGVLDRDDVARPHAQFVEHGVERGRLAAARRAGDQEHPADRAEPLLDVMLVILVHAQMIDALLDALGVEQADGDLFAFEARRNGQADVQFAAVHRPGPTRLLGLEGLDRVQVGQGAKLVHQPFGFAVRQRGRVDEDTVDYWIYFLDDQEIDQEVWFDKLSKRREILKSICTN